MSPYFRCTLKTNPFVEKKRVFERFGYTLIISDL
jgi:hypothetical protein